MTGFHFDPNASLKLSRNRQALPNLPIAPNRQGAEREGREGLGRLGRLGTVPAGNGKPRSRSEVLSAALDHFEERAAIREHDGNQSRAQAEAAALIEAATFHGISTEELQAAPATQEKGLHP